MWGAIAAGVAAIIGGIIQNRANKKAAERQNAANLELSKYTAEQNQAAIDKQNAYNAPAQQIARYTEAGLNPNLMYTQGNVGNQQSAAHMDTPSAIVPANKIPIPEVLSMYQDVEMKKAQIDAIKAQTQNTNERTATEKMNAILREAQGRATNFDLDTRDMLRPYSLSIAEQNVRQSKLRVDQTFQQLVNLRKDSMLKDLVGKQKQFDIDMQPLKSGQMTENYIYSKYRNQFQSMGIGPNDNFMIRLMGRMLEQTGLNPFAR